MCRPQRVLPVLAVAALCAACFARPSAVDRSIAMAEERRATLNREPPPPAGVYEGYYNLGFETSVFYPCGFSEG